jgi:hypothetical protein
MPRYRFHLNFQRETHDAGDCDIEGCVHESGGDTSRVVDIDADDLEHAKELLSSSDHPVADNEEVEQINEIHLTPPVPDPQIDWALAPVPPPSPGV